MSKRLSCLPCGDSIPLDTINREKLQAWVLEHSEHINGDEPWRPLPKEKWRSSR